MGNLESMHNKDEHPPNKCSDLDENPLSLDPNAKKITNLNDMCLEKIFEYLNFQSLFNVAIANEFLRPAAASVYKRRFGHFKVKITGNGYFTNPRPIFVLDQLIVDQLRSILLFLRCFGSQITVLKIESGYCVKKKKYEYINQYVNKYCADNLVRISFESVPKITAEHFPKPFVNVANVEVRQGSLGRYLPSFAEWFPNMGRLTLIKVNMFQNRLTDLHFQHLEHLIIHDGSQKLKKTLVAVKVESANMQRFVNNHPHLVVLDVPGYHFTVDMANNLLRQPNSLTKFRFHFNLSKYKRFVAPLNGQWTCSNQALKDDNICVTMEKRAN